ncbi:respiratory nitrate reductase gamma chain [Metallosphaera sedula]|nr:respiratory nitrate reductase gamma chain [Metallosphaera sedula]
MAITFLLYALWPFSRLVHVFTLPVTYLWRPYIVYRGQGAQVKRGY